VHFFGTEAIKYGTASKKIAKHCFATEFVQIDCIKEKALIYLHLPAPITGALNKQELLSAF
jgi:hypothetical protein